MQHLAAMKQLKASTKMSKMSMKNSRKIKAVSPEDARLYREVAARNNTRNFHKNAPNLIGLRLSQPNSLERDKCGLPRLTS